MTIVKLFIIFLTNLQFNWLLILFSGYVFYATSTWKGIYFLVFAPCINYQLVLIPGLQNALSNLHPIIIVLSYSIFLYYTLYKNKFIVALIFGINLILGGYWAFQEYTWGGWWNWDGVETPAFCFITLVYFKVFHTKLKQLLQHINVLRLIWLLLCIVLYITRFTELSSVHSFILSDTIYKIYWGVCLNASLYNLIGVGLNLVILNTWLFLKFYLLLILFSISIIYGMVHHTKNNAFHFTLGGLGLLLLIYNISFLETLLSLSLSKNIFFEKNLMWIKPTTFLYHNLFTHLGYLIN